MPIETILCLNSTSIETSFKVYISYEASGSGVDRQHYSNHEKLGCRLLREQNFEVKSSSISEC